MRLPQLEPGNAELDRLREEFDLRGLVAYLEDPRSSKRLRRRAVLRIASLAPGGGRASALTGATDPAVIPILGPLLEDDPDHLVRRSAAYGLRRTGDAASIAPLLRALGDTDEATRNHAIWGLGDLGAREAVGPIGRLLDDEGCGTMAARALAKIGDERAVGALWLAATMSGSGRRRKQFQRAATDLESRTGLRSAR